MLRQLQMVTLIRFIFIDLLNSACFYLRGWETADGTLMFSGVDFYYQSAPARVPPKK